MGCGGCLWMLLDELAVLFFPLFPFSFLFRTGDREKGTILVTSTVTLILCVFLTTQPPGSPKVQTRSSQKTGKRK
ncbi:hypothetical protein HOY82DRAFT_564415 [Tuber indicum]|nr:hypothetical protein HOY82DRAFT_564415 [Tuber indicum]